MRFFVAAVALFLLCPPAIAADVFRDTPFFAREDGRMVPVDRIPADVEIVPLKATPDGQWLRVWWKEREGWIRARDVRGVDVNKLRVPAAVADATESLSPDRNAVRFDFALMARRVGIGLGAGYFRRAPFLEFIADTRVDVGTAFYYFPSPVGGMATQLQLTFRGLHAVLGKIEVGGEFGGFWNRYVADDPFNFGDNVDNTFGVVLGPMGTYTLSPTVRLAMSVRVLLAATVNTQLAFGAEFRF